jgi:hypothetical protein
MVRELLSDPASSARQLLAKLAVDADALLQNLLLMLHRSCACAARENAD